MKNVKRFCTVLILILINSFCFSQYASEEKLNEYPISIENNNPLINFGTFHINANFIYAYEINHNPTSEDTSLLKKYSKLITSEPSKTNYENYYFVACSLWELNRLTEAESMFLEIINSTASFYVNSTNYSSDILGDTTSNIYGYGSFTTNYQNYAARYLAKIYIDKKQFKSALRFVEIADKKCTVQFNCGTGHRFYRNEIDNLYGLCYEGLNEYDRVIDLFLPKYYEQQIEILIRALTSKYSHEDIINQLQLAEKSIVCIIDTVQSSIYSYKNYGEKDEIITETKYTGGEATINLFGKDIDIPCPNLNQNETLSKEILIENFKESGFYLALTTVE